MGENEPGMKTWIKERINDKKHFTARYAFYFSEKCGVEPATVAAVFAIITFLILAFSEMAFFVGNFILIVVPALLIFAYPKETPTEESLLIYFSAFGIITVFDRSLEKIPLYFVIKLALFLLLFIPPFRLVDHLEELTKKKLKDDEKSKSNRKSQRSQPETQKSNKSIKSAPQTSNQEKQSEKGKPSSQRSSSSLTTMTNSSSSLTPSQLQAAPSEQDVKVTIIEEYYREEELVSPNGTVVKRFMSGPFRRETVTTERERRSQRQAIVHKKGTKKIETNV